MTGLLHEGIFNSLRCESMNRVMLSPERSKALGRTAIERGRRLHCVIPSFLFFSLFLFLSLRLLLLQSFFFPWPALRGQRRQVTPVSR